MDSAVPRVIPWSGAEPPTEEAIRRRYAAEGLQPYRWANAPGDTYAAHRHSYAKVLYCVSGAISFGLGTSGQRLALAPGDRLELPADVPHDAVVGPHGVVCLEAHRG